MTWQPPEETDSAIRAWMSKQGWPVTETPHDFVHRIYVWQHDVAGECYTLWITERAIEDTKPVALLVEALDRLKVADKMREQPEMCTLLKSSPTGTDVVVEQLPGPPE